MNVPIGNPLFLVPVMSGIIFVIMGIIMHFFPPKKINMLYGYRTPSSKKTQEHWDFAQNYGAKTMIIAGVILLICGLLGFVFYPSEKTGTLIGISILVIVVIGMFSRVEGALRKKFGND